MKIDNKKLMYQMLHAGLFGNTWWSWQVEDFVVDPAVKKLMQSQGYNEHAPMWAVRSGTPGGPFLQGLTFMDAYHEGEKVRRKWGGSNISPLDDFMGVERITQGYICKHPGLYFNQFGVSGTMRDGEREMSKHHDGSAAVAVLKHFLRDEYDDVVDLLDRYPDSEAEFTLYNKPVGTLAALGKRAVIWEVRHY